MINPVTDIAGLNSVSRVVLGNAAHSLVGMMLRPIKRIEGSHPASSTVTVLAASFLGRRFQT
jgi:uncharacterized protein (UPF0261 family)